MFEPTHPTLLFSQLLLLISHPEVPVTDSLGNCLMRWFTKRWGLNTNNQNVGDFSGTAGSWAVCSLKGVCTY